ncbi:MAG TPA: neuraminidase-like domain-containing protein [Pseudomonas sp.]|uniref:neuraminidase-like domain-containing protein n=1 Tax=Pseudomonas sp. TaxID=306 RepID=UPI002ED9E4C6
MNNGIVPVLEENRRDALVSYYLGKMAASLDNDASAQVKTPEDLYEYLLIDNQVSGEVDTSRVAQGIASIQQHVHAIYNGMEPGFGQVQDIAQHRAALKQWHDGMSEYSTWAGYQMVADYPENYLDPSLRLGKTEAFKTFESELAQSRINRDNVQKALGNYLARFEEVSNLASVCCYIDGVDFRRADYYFVGRQRIEPFAYYWRKADIDLNDDSTHVLPSAWSEWKKIDIKTGGTITHVRAVVVQGRLHLVWLEQVREVLDDNGNSVADSYLYHLNTSYLQSNGQ